MARETSYPSLIFSSVLACALTGCATTTSQPAHQAQSAAITPGPAFGDQPPPALNHTDPNLDRPLTVADLSSDYTPRYTVRPGDTVWSIAAHYLRQPWRYTQLWGDEPIDLSPGDILELSYTADGQPRLSLAYGENEVRLVRLSPRIREERYQEPVPTVPTNAIQAYLIESRLVNKRELRGRPYVVGATEERLSYTTSDTLYVRGYLDELVYRIYRPGREIKNAQGRYLATELLYMGDAGVIDDGLEASNRLARLEVLSVREGIRNGDLLFPGETAPDEVFEFFPRATPDDIQGQIVAADDQRFLVGRYQTVILDLGENQGLDPGNVLQIMGRGNTAVDPFVSQAATSWLGQGVRELDGAPAGLVMVYRTFDNASYALVMEAGGMIRVGDAVKGSGF